MGSNNIGYYRINWSAIDQDTYMEHGYICIIVTGADLSEWLINLKDDFSRFSSGKFGAYIKKSAVEQNDENERYSGFNHGAYADAEYQEYGMKDKIAFLKNMKKFNNTDDENLDRMIQGEAAQFLRLDYLADLGCTLSYVNATMPFQCSVGRLAAIKQSNSIFKEQCPASRIAYYIDEKIGTELIIKYKEEEEQSCLENYIDQVRENFNIHEDCHFPNMDLYNYLTDYPSPEMTPPYELIRREFCAVQNIVSDFLESKREETRSLMKRLNAPQFRLESQKSIDVIEQLFSDTPTHFINILNWNDRKQSIDYFDKMERWGISN